MGGKYAETKRDRNNKENYKRKYAQKRNTNKTNNTFWQQSQG